MKKALKNTSMLILSLAIGKLSAQSSTNFNYTGTLQYWTVPCGVTSLTVTTVGGGGGASPDNSEAGGHGATIVGIVSVNPGDGLDIIVAGKGTDNSCCEGDDGGAGGGGTFIYDSTTATLLEVAGGGGGAHWNAGPGFDGSLTTTPTGSNGGSGELGGSVTNTDQGGGGAGFLGNGQTNGNIYAGTGGSDFANGFGGGAGDAEYDLGCVGGYGGGGGGGGDDGGGAGGYNGGGSGGPGGGGGGSYVNGAGVSGLDTNVTNGFTNIQWYADTITSVTGNVIGNDTCGGGNDGMASAIVVGGATPLTYSWTGGSTHDTAGTLTAGNYTVTVTTVCGFTATAMVTITQPATLMVSGNIINNDSCNSEGIGKAYASVSGGTGPYTYSWSGGSIHDTAGALTAGTYTINVHDVNGCVATSTIAITQPTALVFTKNSSPDNGSGNGAAWVSISGGTSPYVYSWSPGGKTTDSISGLSAGTYCCYMTDANGCIASVCDTVKSTAGIGLIGGNSGKIALYPNPNNGQFTIQSSVGSGQLSVEVYNVLGEKVFSGNLNPGNNTINMSNQSNGIYLYRVMNESGTLISEGKISVQK